MKEYTYKLDNFLFPLRKNNEIQTREKSLKNFIRLIWKNLKKD